MKSNDVLFCRVTVVNSLSQTMAYHILRPNNAVIDIENSFLSSFFIDVNINEITQEKTFFIEMSIEELKNLPLENNIPMVIFLNTQELSEQYFNLLNEMRFHGFQFGIINPDPNALSEDLLSVFSYVLFSLEDLPSNTVIERRSHPLLVHKNLWVNKIDTLDQFTFMKNGTPNAYFSGDFIKKMTPIKGQKVLAYQTILLDLLTELNDRNTSFEALSACIERDPSLTYRIIKLTHSSAYNNEFNVSSVQRAVEIIGIRDLMKWTSLVMLASIPGKPASLVSMAISRAFFCQNISQILFPKSNGAFLVGLFSFLPSFFDDELPALLKELPLDDSIKAALLEYSGNLGGVLKIVEAYESGRWEKIPFNQLECKNISEQTLKALYVESLKSAREMSAL